MNTKFAALAVLGTFSLLAVAPQAEAADNGFYIGAGVTQTDFKITVDDVDGSETLDDSSFKIIAGFRPLDWLAVEANYIDLGDAEFDDGSGVTIGTTALTASVLFIKEFQVVDLFLRAGVAKWEADFEADGDSISEDGVEPIFGGGVGVHFGSFGARLEYEQFENEALDDFVNTDVKTLSLSFTYTFL